MKAGRLSVRELADRFGYRPADLRQELQELDARHGGLIERRDKARSKIWIVEARLVEVWPHYARAATHRDVARLDSRLDRVETIATRAADMARQALGHS